MKRERILTMRGAQTGWLWKMAGKTRLIGSPWQRRWFVLDGARLDYYDKESRGTLKGTVDLSECVHVSTGVAVHDSEKPCGLDQQLELTMPGRTFLLRCDGPESYRHWQQALTAVVDGDRGPNYMRSTAAKCSARTPCCVADADGLSEMTSILALALRVHEHAVDCRHQLDGHMHRRRRWAA
jgi:hypothetical protein